MSGQREKVFRALLVSLPHILPPPLPPPAASQGSFSTWEGGICVVTRSSFPLICTLPSFLAAVGPLSSAGGGTA